MPNRILKDSICTSPTIDALTRDEEVFFYRLIVNCDDYGLMDARPKVLRAKLYPLMIDRMSDDVILTLLRRSAEVGLIDLYQVSGRPYLHMRTWKNHQQIRAVKTKYPAPEQGIPVEINSITSPVQLISNDIKRDQPITHAPVIQSNPIRIQSNPHVANATQAPKPKSAANLLWDALVAALGYQPHPGNEKERAAWNAAIKTLLAAEETPETARSLIEAYRARWPGIDCTPSALASKQALIRSARHEIVPPTRLTGRAIDAQEQNGHVDYTLSPEQERLNARNEARFQKLREEKKHHALSTPENNGTPTDRADHRGTGSGGIPQDAPDRAPLP